MKKLMAVCAFLVLVAILATTAFAAVPFSVSPSQNTLQPGESVTLRFSVSSDTPATSYGLMVSYDTAVFELVEGSCNASDALVTSFNNGFAFMFQNATAYSGDVGTITLKVKADAAPGSYEVSGMASVKNGAETVSATGCAVTLTVTGEGMVIAAPTETTAGNHISGNTEKPPKTLLPVEKPPVDKTVILIGCVLGAALIVACVAILIIRKRNN